MYVLKWLAVVEEDHLGRDIERQVPAVAGVFEVLHRGGGEVPPGVLVRGVGLVSALAGPEAQLDDDRLGLAEHDRGCFPLRVAEGQDHCRYPRREPVRAYPELDLKTGISAGHPSYVA
jgi:hypothetical protein